MRVPARLGKKAIIWLAPCLVISFIPCSVSAFPSSLPKDLISIENRIRPSLPAHASWSLSVLDAGRDQKIMEAGNTRGAPLMSGSLIKLFTSAALLDLDLREKVAMDTIIAHDGLITDGLVKGNLYIKGSGNAFLSEKDLHDVIDDFLLRGIGRIEGDIIVDETFFHEQRPGWTGSSHSRPGALGLDLHTVSITVLKNSRNVKIEPANDAVGVRFAQGEPSIRQIDDFTYLITMKREMPTDMKKRFSLHDPAIFVGWTLMTLLKNKGIHCSGTVSRGTVPDTAEEIHRIHSPDVPHMVRDTNYYSLNITAENMLLYLGAKRYGAPGTVEKGIRALTGFLIENGLDSEGMVFADGSGVSHDNRVTPAFVVRFLQKASEKPWFGSFYESLPRAGIDGTLRDVGLRDERIRAKTGRLDDVYCLAGYVNDNDGHRIAFAYMVNGSGAGVMGPVNDSGMKVLQYLTGDAH